MTAYGDPGSPAGAISGAEIAAAGALGRRVADSVRSVVEVRAEVVEDVVVALLAEGHILIEDLPGVGKTTLARAVARSLGLEFARVQCTADLLPADVVGHERLQPPRRGLRVPSGADLRERRRRRRDQPRVAARRSPGMLECMQERRVTVDVHTHELARPFVVLATQNPVEFEGTYPLPEAQVDRFMMRISLGYPDAAAEAAMLGANERGDRVDVLEAVGDAAAVLAAQDAARRVHSAEAVRAYVVALLGRTRADPRVELGASPRAGLLLLRAAKARALLRGPRPRAAGRRPGARERRAGAPHRARAGGRRRQPGDDRRRRARRDAGAVRRACAGAGAERSGRLRSASR